MRRLLLPFLAVMLSMVSVLATASTDYVTYLHSDVQGSPVVATDEAGEVMWQESYGPWGERELRDPASSHPARGGRNWYTGKEETSAIGLYYYGARWYSPDAGQFLSIDPAPVTLESPRSFSRYAYANNSPVKYVDPDGRVPLVVFGIGLLATNLTANAPGIDDVPIKDDGAALFLEAAPAGKLLKSGHLLRSVPDGSAKVANNTPRRASAAQRESALERATDANGVERCTYCNTPLDRRPGQPNSVEIDHRKAYAKGGETKDSNLDAACRTCNRSKGSKELGTEWIPPNRRKP